MSRPRGFERVRYLGDKARMVVYDLDRIDEDPQVAAAVEEIVAAERFATFAPDTLAEAANRGYRPARAGGSR